MLFVYEVILNCYLLSDWYQTGEISRTAGDWEQLLMLVTAPDSHQLGLLPSNSLSLSGPVPLGRAFYFPSTQWLFGVTVWMCYYSVLKQIIRNIYVKGKTVKKFKHRLYPHWIHIYPDCMALCMIADWHGSIALALFFWASEHRHAHLCRLVSDCLTCICWTKILIS